MSESQTQLLELVKQSRFALIFTGAGVSTESGIPDFRSTSGLYSEKYENKSPEQILSLRTFRENKPLFFRFYIERIGNIVDKQPNRSHLAIKELVDRDIVKAVLTQNIDNLHEKAGTKHVIDLHGNSSVFYCTSACGYKCDYATVVTLMHETKKYPICPDCGGVVRPQTILFDENLNDDAYDTAFFLCVKADLMIAIGSSLVVQPAARLVDQIPTNAKLVIINRDSTPYDGKADLVIRENCGEVLENLVRSL
jgi:NAD-dependent deacetylase